MTAYRKKLIEVAMPLDTINKASVREKSIRHGHPSTLHRWWARKPLATCRSVLFGQLVDDPSAWPDLFPTEAVQDKERQRIFRIIEDLVVWKNSTNDVVLDAARLEIAKSYARGRLADSEGNERDEAVLKIDADAKTVRAYLAEVLPPVHDPFAGGGSIPLEAQRLGLRAIATDLNPVAVMINKALIEIPPKFAGRAPVGPPMPGDKQKKLSVNDWPGATGLAEDVRRYGAWMREEAFKRIGHLYPKVKITEQMAEGCPDLQPYVGQRRTVIAWLWARTTRCPNPGCAVQMPLIHSFVLSTKKGKETWVEAVVNDNGYAFEIRKGSENIPEGTVNRNGARCVCCETPVPLPHIRAEAKAGRMGARMIAIVAEGNRSRVYLPPTEDMEAIAASADPQGVPDTSLPDKALGFSVQGYGMLKHRDLFTMRQLAALSVFSDLIREARAKVIADATNADWNDNSNSGSETGGINPNAYGDAIAVYLSFSLSKLLDYNSSLVCWGSSRDQATTTLARQTLSMVWNFAEVNMFAEAAGDITVSVAGQSRAIAALPATVVAHASQQAAQLIVPSPGGRIISTDPPYYDNIGYADLSDFFYVWLRRSLRTLHPSIFGTVVVPKVAELIAEPYRHGGRSRAEAFFLEGMTKAIEKTAQATPFGIPVTIYYAFKQSELRTEGVMSTGWETFLGAIFGAGFSTTGTWPIRTEQGMRPSSIGANALTSSIILVCRKRPGNAATTTRGDFRRLLKQELPPALKKLQKGNIAPVDLAQASIGPGMAVFSRHTKVIEADGSIMTVRGALQLIHQVMDEIRGEEEGELDRDTRFAVTWFESHGFESGPYGDAETIAKAQSVSVLGVQGAGVLHSAASKVRLLKRAELPDDWDPATDKRLTVWEATQHLIKRLDQAGESAAAALIAKLGATADQARVLAYRLYTICERKGWAEEARAYNGLVIAWPELEKLASSTQTTNDTPAQAGLFK